jgi:hypothetical protein
MTPVAVIMPIRMRDADAKGRSGYRRDTNDAEAPS